MVLESNESSSKQLLDHETKKKIVVNNNNSVKSSEAESDTTKKAVTTTSTTTTTNSTASATTDAVSDLFTGRTNKNKQIAALCDWLIDKKSAGDRSGTTHYHHHVKDHHRRRRSSIDEERELLLPPPATAGDDTVAIDRSFDRQVSLPRLSSESSSISYAGSLFSGGTTLDGNFSETVDIKDETTSSSATRRPEEEEQSNNNNKDTSSSSSSAQKYKESYYLQLTLAKRLTSLASLATEPVLTLDSGIETWDAESTSYRLWVIISISNSTPNVAFDYMYVYLMSIAFSGEWVPIVL